MQQPPPEPTSRGFLTAFGGSMGVVAAVIVLAIFFCAVPSGCCILGSLHH